jgi:NADH-quinone oxidoreductase subunit F
MGTCGRGNGAEEVFHALNEAIQRSGLDVLLASVGCFGSCFQEPLVGVRLPGNPLVMLHRVRANDAGRILEAVSSGNLPPISSTARSRSGITSRRTCAMARAIRRFLRGMPIPFFKGQKKIVLRNCGLINPSDIEEYIAVGGYQALYKVLIDNRTGRRHRADQGLAAARAGRRGIPHRQQVGFSGQGQRRRQIHHLQRR